jgi:hypothetical protein
MRLTFKNDLHGNLWLLYCSALKLESAQGHHGLESEQSLGKPSALPGLGPEKRSSGSSKEATAAWVERLHTTSPFRTYRYQKESLLNKLTSDVEAQQPFDLDALLEERERKTRGGSDGGHEFSGGNGHGVFVRNCGALEPLPKIVGLVERDVAQAVGSTARFRRFETYLDGLPSLKSQLAVGRGGGEEGSGGDSRGGGYEEAESEGGWGSEEERGADSEGEGGYGEQKGLVRSGGGMEERQEGEYGTAGDGNVARYECADSGDEGGCSGEEFGALGFEEGGDGSGNEAGKSGRFEDVGRNGVKRASLGQSACDAEVTRIMDRGADTRKKKPSKERDKEQALVPSISKLSSSSRSASRSKSRKRDVIEDRWKPQGLLDKEIQHAFESVAIERKPGGLHWGYENEQAIERKSKSPLSSGAAYKDDSLLRAIKERGGGKLQSFSRQGP